MRLIVVLCIDENAYQMKWLANYGLWYHFMNHLKAIALIISRFQFECSFDIITILFKWYLGSSIFQHSAFWALVI